MCMQSAILVLQSRTRALELRLSPDTSHIVMFLIKPTADNRVNLSHLQLRPPCFTPPMLNHSPLNTTCTFTHLNEFTPSDMATHHYNTF